MRAAWIVTLILLALVVTTVASPAAASYRSQEAGVVCPAAYTTLTKALTVLEGVLQVGITYNQYESYLTKVRIAYNQEPVGRASLSCLDNVGIPTEDAMNDFILASNSWGSCINRIYAGLSSSCTTSGSYGDGSRQVYWERASAAIARAVNNLG